MVLNELLHKLGARIGHPELALNSAGVCRLVIGGSLGVSIEKIGAGSGVILYSVIGSTPESGREKLFARLLEAQLYFREIGEGCAFGLDSTTGELVLSRKLALESVQEEKFYAVLSEFVNWAEHWREALKADVYASTKTNESEFHDLHPSARV